MPDKYDDYDEDDYFDDDAEDVSSSEYWDKAEADFSDENTKYPDIHVQLTGRDGNAFGILGTVQGALRDHGVSKDERDAFMAEATSGDYNSLLRTCMNWVSVS